MQHGFMPGDVVKYNSVLGEVIARGGDRGRYWVQILFKNGTRLDVVNKDIKKIQRA